MEALLKLLMSHLSHLSCLAGFIWCSFSLELEMQRATAKGVNSHFSNDFRGGKSIRFNLSHTIQGIFLSTSQRIFFYYCFSLSFFLRDTILSQLPLPQLRVQDKNISWWNLSTQLWNRRWTHSSSDCSSGFVFPPSRKEMITRSFLTANSVSPELPVETTPPPTSSMARKGPSGTWGCSSGATASTWTTTGSWFYRLVWA